VGWASAASGRGVIAGELVLAVISLCDCTGAPSLLLYSVRAHHGNTDSVDEVAAINLPRHGRAFYQRDGLDLAGQQPSSARPLFRVFLTYPTESRHPLLWWGVNSTLFQKRATSLGVVAACEEGGERLGSPAARTSKPSHELSHWRCRAWTGRRSTRTIRTVLTGCEDQWRHEHKADEAGREEFAKGHRSPPYGSEQTEELHGIV
jgi:hypothetical protein